MKNPINCNGMFIIMTPNLDREAAESHIWQRHLWELWKNKHTQKER